MANKPRVVAVPFPMQGHITPLLQLSYQLAAAGIDITFVNTFRNHERLVGSKDIVSKVHSSGVITFAPVSDGVKSFDGGFNESLNAALVASDEIAKPFEELIRTLDGVVCVISDGYLGWSQEVASRLGFSRVALWTSNVAYSLVNYHLPQLLAEGYVGHKEEPLSTEFLDKLVTCVPGLEPIRVRDLPTVMRYESGNDPGFANRIRKIQALRQASWVLVNSFEELESDGVRAMRRVLGTDNYVTVGPIRVGDADAESRKSLWEEDEACLKWLDSQTLGSVLYISFGSFARMRGVQMRSIVRGLERAKQPFLWAMRKNLLVSDAGFSEEQFVDWSTKQRFGLVVEWAPQVRVLRHLAVGGHLSHCGWNSVLESIVMGVPILGWPCVAEQMMNCKRIAEDWKIGLRFMADDTEQELVSDLEVARVIKTLFCDDEGVEIKKRAMEFSVSAKSASAPGGSSHRNVEKLIRAIKSGKLAN